jgi:hypothetical protein
MALKYKVLVAVLILSLLVNGVFLYRRIVSGDRNTAGSYSYLSNTQYGEQRNIFRAYDSPCAIAFTGDSHIYKCHWSELLGIIACNRGIGSDVAEGVFNRIGDILKARPQVCFIAVGSNDIDNKIPDDVTIGFVKRIVDTLKAAGVRPVLMELTQVATTYPNKEFNAAADRLNQKFRSLCETISIDVVPTDLQEDGIHLTASGYEKWKLKIADTITAAEISTGGALSSRDRP